jgi:hypothetical protein
VKELGMVVVFKVELLIQAVEQEVVMILLQQVHLAVAELL